MAARGPTPALTVQVVAHQWYWDFEYTGLRLRTRNALRVPAGEVVRLELSSADVVHSFWIPGMATAIAVGPGTLQTLDLRFGRGDAVGACDAECGCGAGCMSFHVRAEVPARFERWWRRRSGQPTRTPREARDRPPCAAREPSAADAAICPAPGDLATICHTVETRGSIP